MADPNHTREQAQSALESLAPIFRACIDAGWADYRAYPPELRLVHSKHARARLVYDHVRARLTAALMDIPGVSVVPRNGLILIVVDDEYVIKVPKKLSRARLSRTYPTQQTLAFMSQDPQGQFEFLTDRTALIVGYALDDLELNIDAVFVTCPNGPSRNHWYFEVPGAATGASTVVVGPAGGGLPSSPFQTELDDAIEGDR